MILTLFESVQRAYTRPEQIINTTWEKAAEFLTTHIEADTKEEVPLFNLWEFDINGEYGRRRIYEDGQPTENYEEIPGTIRRCKKNARALYGLVLDYDGKASISEAVETFNRCSLEAVIYTTFRNTQETNKFRVVLPFSRPLNPSEVRSKKKSIAETFPEVDHASFSESQAFYLHSGNETFTYWNKGIMLDPDWFEDEPEPVIPEITYSEFTGDRNIYKEMLIESLATCSGLHYASDASHLGVLTLVALCKSAGLTFEEYDALCWNMAAEDSSLKNAQQRKIAWLGWNPHNGIRAETREKFIAAYGGQSKFGQRKFNDLDALRTHIKNKYLKDKHD